MGCARCGGEIVQPRTGMRRKYCSKCSPTWKMVDGKPVRRSAADLVGSVGARIGVDQAAIGRLGGLDREVVLDELRELDAAFRRNPLLGYQPHAQQQRFHSAVGLDLRAFFGGNRAGKTTAGVLDCLVQSVDDDVVPDHLRAYRRWRPPFFCRVVTPDLTNTLEGVVLQKIRDWCPAEQLRGGGFDKAWDKVMRVLHFRNGSWWQFFSNDQDLDKFGGAALHRVYFDEEPRADIRRECLMRLIDFGGDEIFCMTPLLGLSYTFEEIYEPWRHKLLPEGTVTIADMDDNPHLDPREIERVLAGFSQEEREARKSGRFVHFEGLVYPSFSRHRHVVPSLEALPAGEVYVGIDPGIRHMFGVVYCLLDAEDRLTVFDEIAVTGATVRDVARLIGERNARWGCRPRWYVIDPSARNKNHQTGRSTQQEFSDHGITCVPGQNAVTAGINRVAERLQSDPPRLLIAAQCRELVKEFERYRWTKPKRVEGDPKEAPVKERDDLLDPLRYVCMARPLRPEVRAPQEALSVKDRMLRQMLDVQGLGKVVDHPSGDIFA